MLLAIRVFSSTGAMTNPTLTIRDETPADIDAIFALTAAAFAPMPFSDGTEPYIINALRADGDLTLSPHPPLSSRKAEPVRDLASAGINPASQPKNPKGKGPGSWAGMTVLFC